MIDAAVKIIDRIIQLLEKREKQKRKIFDDLVHPIFSDMEKIHSDYLNGLTGFLIEFQREEGLTIELRNRIGLKKTELEAVRVKIHSIAKHHAYKNVEKMPRSVSLFINLCLKYFRITSGEIRDYVGHYTDLIILLENYDLGNESDIKAIDSKDIDRFKDSISMAGYDRVPLGEDRGYSIIRSMQRGPGDWPESLSDDSYKTKSELESEGWTVKDKKVPTLNNIGTVEQNIDRSISYLRITWNEISSAYVHCQSELI